MSNKKKLIIVCIAIGISSQIYIGYYIPNFKVSFAAVIFPVILYLYKEINSVLLGVLSGITLYFFRVFAFIIGGGILKQALIFSFPEAIFYIVYGIIFFIFKNYLFQLSVNNMFLISLVSDFLCNNIEVYIRIKENIFTGNFNIVKYLFIVAIIRALIASLIIILIRYYKMFLIKEEHEERYKKLLWFTSRLKTEVYWMEKNMGNIEKVMSNAYELFSKITNQEEQRSWANRALEISKDVHEIKKEYSLVVRGITEMVDNRTDNNGMYFYELILILKESMEREIIYKNKKITLRFQKGKDFFTEKHYYLMSIFRNIIMNSIDAIDKRGKIIFTHKINNKNHIFIIEDNGCGINEEDLCHIFCAGFSTKINYNTGQVNRGLGLSLVKNVAEIQLNGKLSVNSNEGQGTTFIISIPIIKLEGDVE